METSYPSLTFTLASLLIVLCSLDVTRPLSPSASSQRSAPSNRRRSSRRPRPGGRPRPWWETWGRWPTPCPSSVSSSPPPPRPPPLAAKAGKTKRKRQNARSGRHQVSTWQFNFRACCSIIITFLLSLRRVSVRSTHGFSSCDGVSISRLTDESPSVGTVTLVVARCQTFNQQILSGEKKSSKVKDELSN